MYQVRLKGTHPGCIAGVYMRGGQSIPAWQPQTADGRNQPQDRGNTPALMVADEDMNDEIMNDPWLEVTEVSSEKAEEAGGTDGSDEGQDGSLGSEDQQADDADEDDAAPETAEVASSAGGTKAKGAGAKSSGTSRKKKG